jgi:hypothetical protein
MTLLRRPIVSKPTLEELGISTDTIIIEVDGGLVTEVHNDPNGVVIFDWDNIKVDEELDEDQEAQRLDDMLLAIARGK